MNITESNPLPVIPEQDLGDVVLSQTSAGACLRGWHRGTARWVSLKLLSVTACQKRWWIKFLQDVSLARHTQSERVLIPLGVYGTCPHVGLVSEWMQEGSLHTLLYETRQYPDLPLPLTLRILLDVAEGLSHLHSVQLLHLALRPSNVLLDQQYRAKVCDWGQWKKQSSGPRNRPCFRDLVYQSPEVFCGDPPSKEADVYSFGIMMLETLNRRLPSEGLWSPAGLQIHVGRQAQSAVMPTNQALSHLILRCCSIAPHSRPSAAECTEELKTALEAFDSEALNKAVLQLKECKERAVLGCKEQQAFEMKVEISNLDMYGGCRHPKSACTKTLPLDPIQGLTPAPQIPNNLDTSRQSSSPSSSSTSSGKANVSGSMNGNPSPPIRLRSHTAPEPLPQSRADKMGLRRSSSPFPPSACSPTSNPTTGLRHHCEAGVSGNHCCQILRERREDIVQRMTEGRLNHLLDVLRSRRALGREEYELITAALTLAGRTRSLLDTCLCLGEHVAVLVVSTLGLVSAANSPSPSHVIH
ncbi:receptor-interacting serine/threonine-protein kinase 2 isoform X2 [Brienomyrus brachyistius]|uniref:receptor-interacting serine/threonine-protein kinase 2 isoform X2 n=1 Tax=Brienomyrus brachyistius TaxID=42636 RepID=UPI0020B3E256|nr:receptor-interacting serine/threonine-protein kinase 2 isoform X2 [Brienomyrus brachyistius]